MPKGTPPDDKGMSPRELLQWILLTVFGGLFVTGLYFIVVDHPWWGLFYLVSGLGGMLAMIRDLLTPQINKVPIRTPLKVLASASFIILLVQMVSVIFGVRSDLDAYVTPRTITAKQADDLREYFSHHEPCVISVKVVPDDPEAMDYANMLFEALIKTKCDIDPPKHNGPDFYKVTTLSTVVPERRDYNNDNDYLIAHSTWVEGELARRKYIGLTGFCVGVDEAAHPDGRDSQDPNHPDPEIVVEDALKYAKIGPNCFGFLKDQNTVPILIGHRPLAIRKYSWLQPWYDRIRKWVEQHN